MNETLQQKEVKVHVMEEKYKKYVDKAKSVIKTLDPKGTLGGTYRSCASKHVKHGAFFPA